MGAAQSGVRARVESRKGPEKGTRSRAVVSGNGVQVDVTGSLTGAIAHALWEARGGDSMTNWADAEAALDQLLAGWAQAKAILNEPLRTTPPPAAKPGKKSRR